MLKITRCIRSIRNLWRRCDDAQAGMTILELLAAVLIGLFTIAAAMDAYLTLHTQSVIQEEVNEMQQSGRAAMRALSEHLRMAGFGLPATLDPLAGSNSDPDSITVTNLDAAGCEATLSAAMASVSDNLVCSGSDLSCFSVGMRLYVFDAVGGVGEFFTVSTVETNPPATLYPASSLSRAYPNGSRVSHILQTSYYLDRADTLHPMLMRHPVGGAPEPYADNIEDLQFTYIMQDGDTLDTPAPPTLVRNVLVHLVARSNRVDKIMDQAYRRRGYAFVVSVRNQE